MTTTATLIAALEPEVRERLSAIDPAHDWFHVQRVRALARALLVHEAGDRERVDLLALLHDVCDRKLGERAMSGPALRERFEAQGVDEATIAELFADLEKFGFPGAGAQERPLSREGAIVRDADRLDALGAIGIARTFAYAGSIGQALHDPELPPRVHADASEYRSAKTTAINHFEEKLVHLPERMQTATAKAMARERLQVLLEFRERFLAEWSIG
ncbi:HD domain-containing protein [Nannocystaceae bacterium ST9]